MWSGTYRETESHFRLPPQLSVGKEEDSRFKQYRPGMSFKFQVRGDPGASVSLLAVDNAVFLLNRRNRLTQSSVNTVPPLHNFHRYNPDLPTW